MPMRFRWGRLARPELPASHSHQPPSHPTPPFSKTWPVWAFSFFKIFLHLNQIPWDRALETLPEIKHSVDETNVLKHITGRRMRVCIRVMANQSNRYFDFSSGCFLLFFCFTGLSSSGGLVLEPGTHFLSVVITVFYCFVTQLLIR